MAYYKSVSSLSFFEAKSGRSQSSTEPILKIAVIGDHRSGKTSLIKVFSALTRICKENKVNSPPQSQSTRAPGFCEDTMPTVFDVVQTELPQNDSDSIKICFLDTAGLEDYDTQRPLAYSGVDAIIICFSVDDQNSYNHVISKWYPETVHYCPSVPLFVFGTKIDLRDGSPNMIDFETGQEVGQELRAQYFECSAKSSESLFLSIQQLASSLMSKMNFVSKAKEAHKGAESSPRSPVISNQFSETIQSPSSQTPPTTSTINSQQALSSTSSPSPSLFVDEPPTESGLSGSLSTSMTSLSSPDSYFQLVVPKSKKLFSVLRSHFNFLKSKSGSSVISTQSVNNAYPVQSNQTTKINNIVSRFDPKLADSSTCSFPCFIIYFYVFCQINRNMNENHPNNDDEDTRVIKYFKLLTKVFNNLVGIQEDDRAEQDTDEAQRQTSRDRYGEGDEEGPLLLSREIFYEKVDQLLPNNISVQNFDSLFNQVELNQSGFIDLHRFILFFYYYLENAGQKGRATTLQRSRTATL